MGKPSVKLAGDGQMAGAEDQRRSGLEDRDPDDDTEDTEDIAPPIKPPAPPPGPPPPGRPPHGPPPHGPPPFASSSPTLPPPVTSSAVIPAPALAPAQTIITSSLSSAADLTTATTAPSTIVAQTTSTNTLYSLNASQTSQLSASASTDILAVPQSSQQAADRNGGQASTVNTGNTLGDNTLGGNTLQSGSSVPRGAIAGGIIGGIAFLVCIIMAVFWWRRRMMRSNQAHPKKLRPTSSEWLLNGRGAPLSRPRQAHLPQLPKRRESSIVDEMVTAVYATEQGQMGHDQAGAYGVRYVLTESGYLDEKRFTINTDATRQIFQGADDRQPLKMNPTVEHQLGPALPSPAADTDQNGFPSRSPTI